MKKRLQQNEYSLWEYTPTLFAPFATNLEPLSLMRRIRFLMEYFVGYRVYYLKDGNVDVGYCVVSSGRRRRYFFATPKDIIVGPYYIVPQYRGKGLSVFLVQQVLSLLQGSFCYAYDYIKHDNTPSIKATERCGFEHVMNVDILPLSRRLVPRTDGEYRIYRYAAPQKEG